MTAINKNTVGPGKTYATLAAWEAARQGDLIGDDRIEIAVCYGGGDLGPFTMGGWNCDNNHYPIIRAASTDPNQVGGSDGADQKFTADNVILSVSTAELNAAGFAYCHLNTSQNIANTSAWYWYVEGLYFSIDLDIAFAASAIRCDNSEYGHFKDCFVYMKASIAGTSGSQFFTGSTVRMKWMNCIGVADARDYAFHANTDGFQCTHATSGVTNPVFINCSSIFLGNPHTGWQSFLLSANPTSEVHAVNCLSVITGTHSAVQGFVGGGAAVKKCFNCATSDESFSQGNSINVVEDCLDNLDVDDILTNTFRIHHRSPTRKVGRYSASSLKGIFGTERLRTDIGAEQLSLCTPEEIVEFFTDSGTFVKQRNEYINDHKTMIVENDEAKAAQIDAGIERLSILAATLENANRNRTQLSSWADQEVLSVNNLILTSLKPIMESVYNAAEDVLQDLDYWMEQHSEFIEGIINSYQIQYDAVGDGSLGSITITQLVPEQLIVIECTSADVAGAEQWTVAGSISGTINGPATTDIQWTDTATGLSFKISVKVATDWAVGDRILLYVSEDPGAIFQKFFRDEFGYAFSQNKTDGTETIADSLAE